MNKITLDKIEKNEVLRYLGCSNESSLDENILDEIERAADVTLSLVTPRAVFAYFTLETLEKAHFFDGNDIRLHLNGCMGAILLAVTIGGAIENKIRAAQTAQALMPVVLDACATSAVESLCDKYADTLAADYKRRGLYLTNRFSPGYGDFPIEKQHTLLKLLDAPRKIGLCVTQSSILTPRKSITAVIGVSDMPVSGKLAGCAHCALREKCEFVRKGISCNVQT